MAADLPRSDDRLRSARRAHRYSQGDLARAAGVSRQAVAGIEAGRWSPSLDVALRIATTLHASVEELFGRRLPAATVTAELAVDEPAATPLQRVLVSSIAGRTVALPLQRDGSLLPGFVPADGLVGEIHRSGSGSSPRGAGASRATASVQVESGSRGFRSAPGASPSLIAAGCDPALPLIRGPLSRHRPAVGFAWWPCGNAKALELLHNGVVHVAAVHRSRGERRRQIDGVDIIGFAAWREGLALAPALTTNVRDVADVAANGLRLANRERGSQARTLLDRQLRRSGIAAREVLGYDTTCTAHLLVASAINSALADAGVTTEPAAQAFGLGFLPWSDEVCELYVPRVLRGSLEIRALQEILSSGDLARQLTDLGGYDATACGSTTRDLS